jgi:hypothetical protein
MAGVLLADGEGIQLPGVTEHHSRQIKERLRRGSGVRIAAALKTAMVQKVMCWMRSAAKVTMILIMLETTWKRSRR